MHYGKALRKDERTESGDVLVFGSNGIVGKHNASLFEEPTVIIGRKGSVGKIIYTTQKSWVIDTAYYTELKSNNVDIKYFYYALTAQDLQQFAITTSIPGINRNDIYKLKIPLPSLSEQKAIVAKLDHAQRLIDIDRHMLAKYDQLIQSVFLDMFGDPVRNEKGWEVRKLGEVGKVQTGKTPSTKVPEYFIGEIPFVTPSDLGKREIAPTRYLSAAGLEKSKSVRKGASMVCCIGATIGKVGIAITESGFNQQINSVEWDNNLILDETGFVTFKFLESEIKRMAKSTTLPILKKSKFEEISIQVPDLGIQKRFADYFKMINSEVELAEHAITKSESLLSSLIQQAFSKN